MKQKTTSSLQRNRNEGFLRDEGDSRRRYRSTSCCQPGALRSQFETRRPKYQLVTIKKKHLCRSNKKKKEIGDNQIALRASWNIGGQVQQIDEVLGCISLIGLSSVTACDQAAPWILYRDKQIVSQTVTLPMQAGVGRPM